MANKPTNNPTQLVFQEVLDLQTALMARKHDAIQLLLADRKIIDEQLKSLGHFDDVPFGTTATTPKAQKAATKRPGKSRDQRFCKLCKVDGHDARAHKSQGKKKKPFTAEEMAALFG